MKILMNGPRAIAAQITPRSFALAAGLLVLGAAPVVAETADEARGIKDTPLAGAWTTACINATSYSARNEVRFTAESMRWRGTSYTATNCVDQDFSFEMHNTYATGLNSGELFELDYVLEKIFFLFSSADAVRQANDYVYCGIKDWRINVPRDVTGKDCGGTTYRAGDATYDLIRIDQGRKLFFGSFDNGYDGKTPESRPVAIDPHQAYLKSIGKQQ